jgi:hypothetical protein
MNVKAGDLAYVTAGVNEGRVVAVVALAASGWLHDGPFKMRPDSLPRWHVAGTALRAIDLSGTVVGGLRNRIIRDQFLRPISGVPVNDDVEIEASA